MQHIPLGVQNFRTLRSENCYYVDKTLLIHTVFSQKGNKVLLITRPRRFGKTLTLSTFDAFLSINKKDPKDVSLQQKLFCGTKILEQKEYENFCKEFMGKFPVLFLSLKNVTGNDFVTAYKRFAAVISELSEKFIELATSSRLSSLQKTQFNKLLDLEYLRDLANIDVLGSSLKNLIKYVYIHYAIKPIVLIDEYDVPLQKAVSCGYYTQMLDLIRSFLSEALKDTDELFQKAVLTGCLRVSKESVFTGLNNLAVNTVFESDPKFSTAFGFTESETLTMLKNYKLSQYENQVKNHYDGYIFGNSYMYCPWDVVNFCEDAVSMQENALQVEFGNFWLNTSGNEIIEDFLDFISQSDLKKMQDLLDGKNVELTVNRELSYSDLTRHELSDFWTLLIYTGYLTVCKQKTDDIDESYLVRIPNEEIKDCFRRRVLNFFKTNPKIVSSKEELVKACISGDCRRLQNYLEELLMRYVSVHDLATKAPHENFYHGFLNGIFASSNIVKDFRSNMGSGEGYPDITLRSLVANVGVIIELKYTSDELKMQTLAQEAILQIEKKKYREVLDIFDVNEIFAYGICFCHKACVVAMKKLA